MTGRARNLMTLASAAIVIISLWYLYGTAAHYGGLLPDAALIKGQGLVLVGLGLLYLLGLLVLAEVWYLILHGLSANQAAQRPQAYASFLSSQIGKYLPTGIFHLVGRFSWLVRYGHDKVVVAKATLLELGIMATVSLFVGLAGFICFPPESGFIEMLTALTGIDSMPLSLSIAVVAAIVVAGWLVFRRYFWQEVKQVSPLVLAEAALFFLLQVAAFAGCYYLTSGSLPFSLLPIFTVSWFVGFAVVGAPGGIGVREAAFVLLSAGIAAPEFALGSIVLFRLVTLAAEITAFVIGYIINDRYKNQVA